MDDKSLLAKLNNLGYENIEGCILKVKKQTGNMATPGPHNRGCRFLQEYYINVILETTWSQRGDFHDTTHPRGYSFRIRKYTVLKAKSSRIEDVNIDTILGVNLALGLVPWNFSTAYTSQSNSQE